jgi:hypothetical protein
MVIPMVIQSTRLLPSGPDQADAAPNVSRENPTGAVRLYWKHLARDRKVVGSNPTSGSKTPGQRVYAVLLPMALLASLIVS